MKVPYSAQIYPPPVVVDTTLLPPLTADKGDAMKKIMANARIPQPQKMKYLSEWQKAKQTGAIPSASSDVVTMDISLKDILSLMEKKADQAMQDGTLWSKWGKAISGLAGRKFWIIPADQTPSCNTIPDGGGEPIDVRYMAGLHVPLTK